VESVWNRARESLKEILDERSYAIWVKPVRYLHSDERAIYLGCPNKFSRTWLQENYADLLRSHLSGAGLNGHKLIFRVLPSKPIREPRLTGTNGHEKQLPLPHMPRRIKAGDKYLNERFTFDRFVVGECNEFAYCVAQALANGSHFSYPSLFVLAKTGLGKSHLVQAIGNSILHRKPTARVLYLTAEDFTNEMIYALRNGLIDQFKNKYRRACDILLLEEMHFLGGKEKTQMELCYTLDALFNDGKMVIFSSPLKAEEIPNMKKMLTSRLTSGVTTSIEEPGFHTRINILKQKATERDVSLPDDVAQYLAEHITQDIRRLEGSLDSLKAISQFLHRDADLDMAKETVKRLLPARHPITVDDIQIMVCKYFKIDVETLRSKSRKKAVSYPRSIAIHLCRRYTEKSLELIGRAFNRNHSTVLYDDDKIRREIRIDENTRREVEFICKQIEDKVR
jgi:chromosomal replication initiator protein